MKNAIKNSLIALFLMLIGTSAVMADTTATLPSNLKIGVVDVSAVVSKSSQVQALKKEQEQKLTELQKWLITVQADVQKQTTKENQEKLIKKYDAEFTKKQEAIRKNYATKLQAIDKSISKTITDQAKAQKYDIVFAKGIVLYGGDDITNSIIKAVK